jgi:hypothetical protein
MIFLLFVSIFNFHVQATVLPAGYILRLHHSIISKPKTIKVEQRVVYAGHTFNETLLFKAPDKLRIYVEKEGDAILFIRDKNNCVAISSNAKLDHGELCSKDLRSNFYYTSIIPLSSFSSFLRSSGIKTNYRNFEITRDDTVAEQEDLLEENNNDKDLNNSKYPVLLLRYKNKPIYVLGLSSSDYNRSLSSVKSDRLALTDLLLDSLKEKQAQVWFETSSNRLLRIFGRDSHSKKDFELNLINYKKDSNNNYMPEFIYLKVDGKENLSYGLKSFETNSEYADEIFNVHAYTTKFNKTLVSEDLNENKKILFNYLKDYR